MKITTNNLFENMQNNKPRRRILQIIKNKENIANIDSRLHMMRKMKELNEMDKRMVMSQIDNV